MPFRFLPYSNVCGIVLWSFPKNFATDPRLSFSALSVITVWDSVKKVLLIQLSSERILGSFQENPENYTLSTSNFPVLNGSSHRNEVSEKAEAFFSRNFCASINFSSDFPWASGIESSDYLLNSTESQEWRSAARSDRGASSQTKKRSRIRRFSLWFCFTVSVYPVCMGRAMEVFRIFLVHTVDDNIDWWILTSVAPGRNYYYPRNTHEFSCWKSGSIDRRRGVEQNVYFGWFTRTGLVNV